MTNSVNIKGLIFNYKTIVVSLLIVVCFMVILFPLTQSYSEIYVTWLQADWLINFQDGGFKRRGMSGSFMFLIQDITGFKLQHIIYGIQLVLYGLFFFLFIKLILRKKISQSFFYLLLSPLAFSYFIFCPAIVGRKEIIFFLIYLIFIKFISKNKLTKSREYIIIASVCVSMFFHELILFYTPYFLMAIYFFSNQKHQIKRYLLYIIPPGCIAFILLVFGKNLNEGNSASILTERGFDLTNNHGVLDWDISSFEYYASTDISHFFIFLIVLVAVIIWFHKFLVNTFKLKGKDIFKFFAFCVLSSLPLFILATDWGRWICIHFIAMLIFIASMLPKSEKYRDAEIKGAYLKTICICLLFFTVTISHCYGAENDTYGVKDLSLTWPVIKIIELIN